MTDPAPPFRLHEEAGWVTRLLLFLSGATLLMATLASTYHDWPLIISGKIHPWGFFLLCLIAIPAAILIVIWSAIGEKRDWLFEKSQLRMRTFSLWAWQGDERIALKDIRDISCQTVELQDRRGRARHWIEIKLANSKLIRSPVVEDAALVRYFADQLLRAQSDARKI